MTRLKKSRTPNAVGKKQSGNSQLHLQKPKKHKGNQSGARNSSHEQNPVSNKSGSKQQRDPRLGSQKKIPLVVSNESPAEPPKPKAKLKKAKPQIQLTPEQEFEQLENNEQLNALLDKAEGGKTLTAQEQQYLDTHLDRYDELCQILGIELDEGDDEQPNEWQQMLEEDKG